jgi:hypothetical protein
VAVFVELTTDAFEETRSGQHSLHEWQRFERVARRPLRGLEIKEDTPAAIKVIQSDGTELPLVDAGAPDGTGFNKSGYTNFLLQNVSEVRMEKSQIVETFGAAFIYFFGESPRFLDVQMVVINSFDFNWEAEWWENYENNFRGTKLVERGARLYMFYDDNIVEGFMLNSQGVKLADQPLMVQMSFRMFVTSYKNISLDAFSGGAFPIHDSAVLSESIETTDPNVPGSVASRGGQALEIARAASFPGEVGRTDFSDFDADTQRGLFGKTVPVTGAIPPGTAATTGASSVESLLALATRSKPVRGKIADNLDEYLGSQGDFSSNVQKQPPAARVDHVTHQEVDDLPISSVNSLAESGANIDNPDTIKELGMIPASAKEEAENAIAFGEDLGSFDQFVSDLENIADDPLGFIRGGGGTVRVSGGVGGGVGSKYGDGPGYGGQIGYGEFGGEHVGNGQGGSRDPGYRDPDFQESVEAGPLRADVAAGSYSIFGGDDGVKLDDSHSGASGGASFSLFDEPMSLFSFVSTSEE